MKSLLTAEQIDQVLGVLADRIVELGIVPSISHETVRRTLKKTG